MTNLAPSTRLAALLLTTVAVSVMVAPGCTTIFPDRDGQKTATGTSNGTEPPPVVATKAQFGTLCLLPAEGVADNCAAPETCHLVSRDKGATMCTHTCETDAACPGGARCTETPAGRICVPTCTSNIDCTNRFGAYVCVPVNVTDSVCWTTDATSGEVRSEAEPTIERIQLLRKGPFSYEPGLPVPGADVQLKIDLKNRGLGDLSGMSATLTPLGSASEIQSFANGSVQNLVLPGYGRLEGALTPTFRLAPELTVGARLEFTVSFRTATETWNSDFSVVAFGPTALPYVTDVELTDVSGQPLAGLAEGTSATLRLFGRNVGFGDLQGVSVNASVTTPNGSLSPVSGGPTALPDSQAIPANALLYQATVTRTAGTVGSILLDVVLTDVSAGTWNQAIEVPVTGP